MEEEGQEVLAAGGQAGTKEGMQGPPRGAFACSLDWPTRHDPVAQSVMWPTSNPASVQAPPCLNRERSY